MWMESVRCHDDDDDDDDLGFRAPQQSCYMAPITSKNRKSLGTKS